MEEKTGLKKIYIDIMINGFFWNQITYTYLPFLPIDNRDVNKQVLKAFPSLEGKNYTLEFSKQRAVKR